MEDKEKEGNWEVSGNLDDQVYTWVGKGEPDYSKLPKEIRLNISKLNAKRVYENPRRLREDAKIVYENTRRVREEEDCFIATAVYGGVNTSEVQVLRDFRDDVLMTNRLGRKVVELYYSGLGRRVANIIKEDFDSAIPLMRRGLDYIVRSI